jgi:tetratricopeptide (TPR) repeat protein
VRYYGGDLAGAEQHFETSLTFLDHPSVRRIPGAAIGAFNYGTWAAWLQGRIDIARERMVRMMAAADENNPYDVVFSGRLAADIWEVMREYEEAERLAPQVLELAEKHPFLEMAAETRCIFGRVRAQRGNAAEGIQLIQQAKSVLLEAGAWWWESSLAIAQERAGAFTDALENIERTIQGELAADLLIWVPDAIRFRGELRLKLGQTAAAETDFREAIALAKKIDAKAWELRATTSLARLLQGTGRDNGARTMLAAIYNWFTEGFDTPDLKDAKALLEELAT